MVNQANHRHGNVNDGAAFLFALIAGLAAMTCFPFIENASAAQMNNTSTPINATSAAQMNNTSTPINVAAVALNASKSIEEDLNSTREAISTGNIQDALTNLEQASEVAQTLSQCMTATVGQNDTGLTLTYPQQQQGMNQSSVH